MGELRDRAGEAVWAGIEQKSQYGAENKKRRDTAASRRLVGLSIWQFAQKRRGNICANRRIFILLSGTYYASPICFK